MMHKIDKNKDGKVSHDEYIAYQVTVFEMMDTGKTGGQPRASPRVPELQVTPPSRGE